MKTCLYCGGNNPDTASVCMICGRDLTTGDHVSRGNGLTSDEDMRKAARLALPRPESPYASLLLLAPALALFLFGLAIIFAPAMEYFYDLKLPEMANVGLFGGGCILISLVMIFLTIIRTANMFRVHMGYQMILREESGDENPLIRCYHRYRERTTSLACLLWLIPVAVFGGLMQMVYLGSVAYYVYIFGIRVALPGVDDPIPYELLLLVGLIFLVVRFVSALRVTLAYKRYDKALQSGDQSGFELVRTGMAAALDAREYPQPETPFIYLLLLPSVLILLLFGCAAAMGTDAVRVLGLLPPVFAHPGGAALLLIMASVALGITALFCFLRRRAVVRGYYEALRMDEETPFSANLEKYAHHQKQACDFYCFLWLLPIGLFLCIMQLFYVGSYARYATLLGRYKFVLPKVSEPLPYVLLSVVAIVFLAILFFVSLNNTLAYRRCDAINRRRHREERERAAEEAAAAEAAAAEAAAEAEAAEEETEGLWGDFEETSAETDDATAGDAAAEDSSLDDFDYFLHTEEEETHVEETPVYALDPLDPLAPLRDIDAYQATPVAATRRAANLHQLCDWFMEFAKSYGYAPELSSARALLAAMATSRVVFVRTRDEASAAFAANLAKFFGSNAPVADVTKAWDSPDFLLFNTTYGSKKASDCLCGMYRAGYAGDAMCAVTLTNAQMGNADLYLTDMLAYAEKPERAGAMTILNEPLSKSRLSAKTEARDGGVAMTVSENIWCLAVSSDATKYAIPAAGYTTGAALAVCLRGKACDPAPAESGAAELSASEFRRLARGVNERYFLPEEQWKKFDRIEAVNDDPNQILDAMLEAVFLPMIARLDPAALGSIDGTAGICETMALSFGADNIPYCMQTLHELGFEA